MKQEKKRPMFDWSHLIKKPLEKEELIEHTEEKEKVSSDTIVTPIGNKGSRAVTSETSSDGKDTNFD